MSIRRGALERRATERLGLQERLDRPQRVEHPMPEGTWADGADDLLDTLPAHEREAVRLRVLENLEYSDIARALDTTPAAARVRVHRGLKALKRHLTPFKENRS
jgi:RNA polymerase sigma-70 factor (ECF subfamily)